MHPGQFSIPTKQTSKKEQEQMRIHVSKICVYHYGMVAKHASQIGGVVGAWILKKVKEVH